MLPRNLQVLNDELNFFFLNEILNSAGAARISKIEKGLVIVWEAVLGFESVICLNWCLLAKMHRISRVHKKFICDQLIFSAERQKPQNQPTITVLFSASNS